MIPKLPKLLPVWYSTSAQGMGYQESVKIDIEVNLHCTSQRAADIRKTSNSACDGDTFFSTSRVYTCLHTCKDKNQRHLREETVQFSCPMSAEGCLIKHRHTKIPVTPLLIGNVPVLPENDQSCGVPVNGTMVRNKPVQNMDHDSVQKWQLRATDHQSP